jgi:hypothetical protein
VSTDVYLCCGNKTGVAHPDKWIGVDIRRPCDVLQDVRTMRPFRADRVFATPPCDGFTDLPWRPATGEGVDILEACLRLCKESGGEWLLENSRFAQRYIGPSTYHYGSTHFWGTIRIRPFVRVKGRISGAYPLRRAALPVIL